MSLSLLFWCLFRSFYENESPWVEMGDCERTSHLRKIRRHQIGKGGWRAEDQGHLSFPSNKLWPVMKDRTGESGVPSFSAPLWPRSHSTCSSALQKSVDPFCYSSLFFQLRPHSLTQQVRIRVKTCTRKHTACKQGLWMHGSYILFWNGCEDRQ